MLLLKAKKEVRCSESGMVFLEWLKVGTTCWDGARKEFLVDVFSSFALKSLLGGWVVTSAVCQQVARWCPFFSGSCLSHCCFWRTKTKPAVGGREGERKPTEQEVRHVVVLESAEEAGKGTGALGRETCPSVCE